MLNRRSCWDALHEIQRVVDISGDIGALPPTHPAFAYPHKKVPCSATHPAAGRFRFKSLFTNGAPHHAHPIHCAGGAPIMPYSLQSAATACGVNRSTILRAIKSGRISATKDELGAWVLEPVEVHRVYPLVAVDGANAVAVPHHAPPIQP